MGVNLRAQTRKEASLQRQGGGGARRGWGQGRGGAAAGAEPEQSLSRGGARTGQGQGRARVGWGQGRGGARRGQSGGLASWFAALNSQLSTPPFHLLSV